MLREVHTALLPASLTPRGGRFPNPQRSDYCPLDLFSGDEGRLRAALQRLLELPQNNLALRSGDGWAYPAAGGGRGATGPVRSRGSATRLRSPQTHFVSFRGR